MKLTTSDKSGFTYRDYLISCGGKDERAVEAAFNKAVRLICEGNTSGFNRSEDGVFSFDVTNVGRIERAQ
jgi:hypothetical protein